MDSLTSNFMHSTIAHILVELDVFKGLPKKIFLDCPWGVWTQVLDYEGLPFYCRKCHMTSHVVACYSSYMVRSMHKRTCWMGASVEHYTITKSSFDDEESLASDG